MLGPCGNNEGGNRLVNFPLECNTTLYRLEAVGVITYFNDEMEFVEMQLGFDTIFDFASEVRRYWLLIFFFYFCLLMSMFNKEIPLVNRVSRTTSLLFSIQFLTSPFIPFILNSFGESTLNP